FANFDEPDPSLPQPGTTKRLRIKTEEAEQEAKVCQYPLIPVNDYTGAAKASPSEASTRIIPRIWSIDRMLMDSLCHRHLLLPGHVHTEQIRRTTKGRLRTHHRISVVPPLVQVERRALLRIPIYYRVANLTANNIYIRHFYEEFPEHITGLVDYVRMDRRMRIS
ncbi:hypothetical protein BJ875DRAFT_389317, partial [Amylocarpus encephaloides]